MFTLWIGFSGKGCLTCPVSYEHELLSMFREYQGFGCLHQSYKHNETAYIPIISTMLFIYAGRNWLRTQS